MLSIDKKILAVTKDGHDPFEYEDAVCIKTTQSEGDFKINVSIADGASTTEASKEWAKMLTRAFAKGAIGTIADLQLQVEQLSQRWDKVVNRKPLAWYTAERVKKGAYATLCGLTIHNSEYTSLTYTFNVMAVGDSCFFHVRDGKLIKAFPMINSSEFGYSPWLLSSNLKMNERVWEHVDLLKGDCQKGDHFLLMTDAVSQWFMHENENSEQPWEVLFQLAQETNYILEFQKWVAEMRFAKRMKNDDTTVIIASLGRVTI